MGELLIKLVLTIAQVAVCMIFGANDILLAVVCFKQEKYYKFGVRIMWVLIWSTMLVRAIW